MRPDEDPAGFARLRQAYEAALAVARRGVKPVESEGTILHRPVEPEATPDDETQDAAALVADGFARALGHRDIGAAATILADALAAQTLPLAVEMALSDELLTGLVQTRDLNFATLLSVARKFRWYEPGGKAPEIRSPLLDRLHARIEAETWLAGLSQTARSWRYWIGDEAAAAARLMLGKGAAIGPADRIAPPVLPLRRMLAQFQFYAGWISHRFDRDRIEALQGLLQRRYPGRPAMALWLGAAVVALGALGLALGTALSPVLLICVVVAIVRRRVLPKFSRPILLATMIAAALVVAMVLLLLALTAGHLEQVYVGGSDANILMAAAGGTFMAIAGVAWVWLALLRPIVVLWGRSRRFRLTLGLAVIVAVLTFLLAALGVSQNP